jgi:hypothetical protein
VPAALSLVVCEAKALTRYTGAVEDAKHIVRGANSAFMALTEQRAISYWSCYYRHDFARGEYPALVALDKLRQSDLG